MIPSMVDWDAGSYEDTAGLELAPVAAAVVSQAALAAGDNVLDLACGSGNAALLAAAKGARVTGIDRAERLLEVARRRARADGLDATFLTGDVLTLPVANASADVVLSVFGVIFASDPAAALREIARVLRPGGRALVSAWMPTGPINDMLAAVGRVVGRITGESPPVRFAWSVAETVGPVASGPGLMLRSTTPGTLAIRAASPEAYVIGSERHPMALAAAPVVDGAGAREELRAAMAEVLVAANEDPGGFLVHTPYVVHELARINA
jgi:SAM-dependent methyltransferase